MSFRSRWLTASLAILAVSPVCADPFFVSTGNPDGLIATASRPDSAGRPEIESADDFVLTQNTRITGGSSGFGKRSCACALCSEHLERRGLW